MDPALGQDVTSAFMDTQKTAARIKFLEKKVEAESQGFDQIDQYESDKMILENLKSQQADDAKQQADLPMVANVAYENSEQDMKVSGLIDDCTHCWEKMQEEQYEIRRLFYLRLVFIN